MNEDIEMMLKEIEQIRDKTMLDHPQKVQEIWEKEKIWTPKRKTMNKKPVKYLDPSSSEDGYREDSE